MTLLFLFLAELPPPPEPSSVETDNTGQIIGVIVLVLMATYVLAFLLRSTVLRSSHRRAPYGYTDAEMDAGTVRSDAMAMPVLNRRAARATSVADAEPGIERRFRQNAPPDGIERRRLGQRRPGSVVDEVDDTSPRVAGARRARRSESTGQSSSDLADVSVVDAATDDATTPVSDSQERVIETEETDDAATSTPVDDAALSGDALSPDEMAALSTPEPPRSTDADVPPHRVEDELDVAGSELPPIEEQGGEPPSADDIDKMTAAADRQERGKVIPFPIRTPRVESPVPDAGPVSPPDAIAITATIQRLLDCANTGRVMEGFRLYTDAHLMRFITSSNLTPIEFREAAAAVEPKPEAEWTRLMEVTDVEWQPDGRVTATVHYKDGDQPDGKEQYTLIRAVGGGWLIDDISPA